MTNCNKYAKYVINRMAYKYFRVKYIFKLKVFKPSNAKISHKMYFNDQENIF